MPCEWSVGVAISSGVAGSLACYRSTGGRDHGPGLDPVTLP
jgi:hypothetical protein